jgi:hypothetical protein
VLEPVTAEEFIVKVRVPVKVVKFAPGSTFTARAVQPLASNTSLLPRAPHTRAVPLPVQEPVLVGTHSDAELMFTVDEVAYHVAANSGEAKRRKIAASSLFIVTSSSSERI